MMLNTKKHAGGCRLFRDPQGDSGISSNSPGRDNGSVPRPGDPPPSVWERHISWKAVCSALHGPLRAWRAVSRYWGSSLTRPKTRTRCQSPRPRFL